MQRNPKPWITTGIALVGASLVAVTPVPTPRADIQHRQFKLVDYEEFDLSQLTSATEANWSGLETILGSSNWLTDPDISQGLTTLFSDLSSNTANPVTNPFSLLIEGGLGLLSSGDAFNAASTAATAVTDNVESALSSGDYSAALTDLENGGTTILYAFLNGYPETVGNELISPEFGLLTNTTDGAATGQIDALQQLSNTFADELSALGGGNLTTTTPVIDPGTLDLSVNLDSILNSLAGGSSDLTLPITPDDVIGDLAGANGDITVPITPDEVLTGLGGASGDITIPVTPAEISQIVGAVADSNGNIDLPITPDDLIAAISTNGNVDLPVTYDGILQDVLGNGGNLTVSLNEESLLSAIAPNGITVDGYIKVPLGTIESLLGLNSNSAINFNIADSTLLNDLTSALGSTGKQDISISDSTLDGIFGPSGNQDITIPASEVESLLTGSNDITIPVSDIEGFLGNAGSQDISISASSLETLLGATGSQDLSIPLSTLESFLPSTLTLDLDIPGSSATLPSYEVDLGQDLLAALGSIAPLSSDLPALLSTDPTLNVVPLLSDVIGDLGLPVTITGGDLPVNLTGVAADLLSALGV
jgi:hypothetical protein